MKYVLDSSCFINTNSLNFEESETYTTPSVIKELKDFKSKALLNIINPEIIKPKKECLRIVKEKAKKTGDINVLSETDIEVIALGIEIEGIVVSDDFDVQNICEELRIDWRSISGTNIKKLFKREKYCPACGKKFKNTFEGNICNICGHKLKYRVVKTKKLKTKKT